MTLDESSLELEPSWSGEGDAASTSGILLDEVGDDAMYVGVHDSSRLGWNISVAVPESERGTYEISLELEMPTTSLGTFDAWAGLQSFARLDGAALAGPTSLRTKEAYRREVVAASFRLLRPRTGFGRHCTLVRAGDADEEHAAALSLWIEAARETLKQAREELLAPRVGIGKKERARADEFLSAQYWGVLTDCARALFDVQSRIAARGGMVSFDVVEAKLTEALDEENRYRQSNSFKLASPVSARQLERLVRRWHRLKRYFERTLFLELDAYPVAARLGSWFSAVMAIIAYMWFVFLQSTIEHYGAVGPGVGVLAFVTAIAYASRERLKEAGRNWLAGRVQSMFAQRVSRARMPRRDGKKRGPVVVAARESFSRSTPRGSGRAWRDTGADRTVLRFSHRGTIQRPALLRSAAAARLRLVFRLDLSPVFARLHDAMRGFAHTDKATGRIVILDVPRNYKLPVRLELRSSNGDGETREVRGKLVMNKNGLLRFEARGER
ncbi:hypothetical protein AKJ09_04262 [Labilithrix luteola]|uniref:Uncharacterized protein n=1 Tax=Labilithrix luteola TaxID=1391654 RepID=A0A0K1PVP0_9BACT|nr:hypothetical protein [Labilithrix luteola]AKU97598.1 hypothetical protein AKJ09_04262 [Labilithrix luteola]